MRTMSPDEGQDVHPPAEHEKDEPMSDLFEHLGSIYIDAIDPINSAEENLNV